MGFVLFLFAVPNPFVYGLLLAVCFFVLYLGKRWLKISNDHFNIDKSFKSLLIEVWGIWSGAVFIASIAMHVMAFLFVPYFIYAYTEFYWTEGAIEPIMIYIRDC